MGKFPIQLCLYGLCQGLIGRQASYTGGQTGEVGARAYLYNGVKLPDINSVYTPELQKTHPYAVIVKGRTRYLSKDEGLDANYDGSEYELVVTDKPLTFSESVGAIWYNINDNAHDTEATGMYSHLKMDGELVAAPTWNNSTNTFYAVSGIPVWSNYTLTNETDLTLPAPSDPVPLYSYNGVELPELPVRLGLDLSANPYVYITTALGIHYVTASPVPLILAPSADYPDDFPDTLCVPGSESVVGQSYSNYVNHGMWKISYPLGIPAEGNGLAATVLWCNTDLYHKDGTLRLAASEPQPVYM